ncbi:hypothetical protein A8F94_21105 [Bacillus sp. FJAT-27225]|uniref:class D sortase n=1 Tax=Bacillus sp. FJAT-27225 TaxID=1743144 RepID=UPI00080C32E2|nr:class D sortase [Bacillus sp. FJAT-27225]OCA82405.1 hypothetical protein A8F94_21105 [Bacillus sp. FJAT-27225]
MRRITAVLLILIGLVLIAYPSGKNLYSDYMQKKIIREWEASGEEFLEIDNRARNSLSQLTEIFEGSLDAAPIEAAGSAAKQTTGAKKKKHANKDKEPKEKSHVLGVIEIKKIGVQLPLLEGATTENMKYGAGHLTGTAYPGEAGNAAIAAHRSRSFGRMFNRLGELESGDSIVIKNKQQTYKYKVFKISIVTPVDTSVLRGNGDDRMLTLITCDPVDTATHRLIIHAKLVP